MKCERHKIDGVQCAANEADAKRKPLGHRPGSAGPRYHHECVSGHAWHENYGEIPFIAECDCATNS